MCAVSRVELTLPKVLAVKAFPAVMHGFNGDAPSLSVDKSTCRGYPVTESTLTHSGERLKPSNPLGSPKPSKPLECTNKAKLR